MPSFVDYNSNQTLREKGGKGPVGGLFYDKKAGTLHNNCSLKTSRKIYEIVSNQILFTLKMGTN